MVPHWPASCPCRAASQSSFLQVMRSALSQDACFTSARNLSQHVDWVRTRHFTATCLETVTTNGSCVQCQQWETWPCARAEVPSKFNCFETAFRRGCLKIPSPALGPVWGKKMGFPYKRKAWRRLGWAPVLLPFVL